MRHTISIKVENHCGELARIVNLISGRGINIESLSVSETLEAGVSKATLTLFAEAERVKLLVKQLSRQVRVITVQDMNQVPHIEREMIFVSVVTKDADERQEVLNMVSLFRAEVIDVSDMAITLQFFGEPNRNNLILNHLKKYGVKECVRTGAVAIATLSEQLRSENIVGKELENR